MSDEKETVGPMPKDQGGNSPEAEVGQGNPDPENATAPEAPQETSPNIGKDEEESESSKVAEVEENTPFEIGVGDVIQLIEDDIIVSLEAAPDLRFKITQQDDSLIKAKVLDADSGEVLDTIAFWPEHTRLISNKNDVIGALNQALKLFCRKATDWCADA